MLAEPLLLNATKHYQTFGTENDIKNANKFQISYEGQLVGPNDPFRGVVIFAANPRLRQTRLGVKFLKDKKIIDSQILQTTVLNKLEVGTNFTDGSGQWYLNIYNLSYDCHPVSTRNYEEWKECLPKWYWINSEEVAKYSNLVGLLRNIEKYWTWNFYSKFFRYDASDVNNWKFTEAQIAELATFPVFTKEFLNHISKESEKISIP